MEGEAGLRVQVVKSRRSHRGFDWSIINLSVIFLLPWNRAVTLVELHVSEVKCTGSSKGNEVLHRGTLSCRAGLSLWSLQTPWGWNPSLTPLAVCPATLTSLSIVILHSVKAEGVVWIRYQRADENRTIQNQTRQEAILDESTESEPRTWRTGPNVSEVREFGRQRESCGNVNSKHVERKESKNYFSQVVLNGAILATVVPSGHKTLVLFLVQGSHLSHGELMPEFR